MIIQNQGLALEIDRAGKIIQVLYNNMQLPVEPGKLFPTLFAKTEFSTALSFMQRLQKEAMVADNPIGMEINGNVQSLYFSGVRKQENFVVMGSTNQGLDSTLYDEIAKVNNELANQLRATMKSNLQPSVTEKTLDLDEFTKINNDLITVQRELNKSNQRLAELNEQKNQLIGIAAHDLRNPLGVMTGYMQFVLGTSKDLSDAHKQMLEKSISTGKKMTQMLEELLDMSEIESGKVVLNKTEADLDAIIRENTELNQVIADRKNIQINYQSPGKTIASVDTPKIEQVINNFLSNAIKYSHNDTTITVSLECEQERIWVRVRDQGQGIPEDEVSKVFEPFKTTSVKATAGEKSTGLGLAITKKVIEVHGGGVGLTSALDKGTEFYFWLPLK